MTLGEYQTLLHALYRGDGNTPTSGDTKWTHRMYLLHAAINMWDSQNVLWNELWVTLEDAATGDKTVNSSDLEYDMPTDFRFLGSFVRTTTSAGQHSFYQVVQPQDAELYKGTSQNKVIVTGNKKTGFDLSFLTQPTAGNTINYPYYKEPFTPTSTAEVIEMSDPYFGVYFALGKLHEQDGAGDRARAAFAMADQKLKVMKTQNMMLPNSQPNGPAGTGGGFGVSSGWGVTRYGAIL